MHTRMLRPWHAHTCKRSPSPKTCPTPPSLHMWPHPTAQCIPRQYSVDNRERQWFFSFVLLCFILVLNSIRKVCTGHWPVLGGGDLCFKTGPESRWRWVRACLHVCMLGGVRVCVYACMHLCMYACIGVFVYARVRVVCMRVWMYACTRVQAYVQSSRRIVSDACVCACMCVYWYPCCLLMRASACIFAHTHIYYTRTNFQTLFALDSVLPPPPSHAPFLAAATD